MHEGTRRALKGVSSRKPARYPFGGALSLFALAAAAALLAAGCASPPPVPDPRNLDPPLDDRVSFVYGYLDMREAPTVLGWMEMRQLSPPGMSRYYQMRVHQGIFYLEKFPPGVFELNEFGGKNVLAGPKIYRLPRQSPALRLGIPAPDFYFLGSWKFRSGRGGNAPPGQFTLDRTGEPSEARVLTLLLPFAKGTAWEERIRARIASLH